MRASWSSRTPSGVTLAPEGGAHQSIGTPLIGMAQDGLASFEPAFVDELAVIMRWAFDYMQRDGEGEPNERTWLRDETGGSVYLRLSTRPLEQPQRADDARTLARDIIDGAYWLREPGPNAQVVVAYHRRGGARGHRGGGADGARTGATSGCSPSPRPTGSMPAGRRRSARASAASSMRAAMSSGCSARLPRHCGLVTVIDGHPATLAWLGAVHGHRTRALGVEHFGQTGTVADLYRHFGIDAQGIVAAAEMIAPGRPIRHLKAV